MHPVPGPTPSSSWWEIHLLYRVYLLGNTRLVEHNYAAAWLPQQIETDAAGVSVIR
jgi:hypothetical protein